MSKLFSKRSIRRKKASRACLIALFGCSLLSTVSVFPAVSADRISFTYGIFGEFYISIADLETFATEGKITPSLAYYADRFSKQDLAKLRDLLNRSFEINQVTASIFLNLPIGKQITKEIGLIIDSPRKVSQPALRASLILAAAKPEGLTILNVLRLYSTKTLRLNTSRIAEAVNEATRLLAETESLFVALAQESEIQTERRTVDFDNLTDLSGLGREKWRRKYITLAQSDRPIHGVVYLPVSKKSAPLVVIAPGLNTNWQNFTYIAEHLASYGFGVAAVNFPATNARRLKKVLSGSDTPPAANEWVEQPKIITQLLDEIEYRSNHNRFWQGKLDLQRVGILGQSLGGYTAMAIAGAKVDWQNLQQRCQKQEDLDAINLNPALVWQCLGAKTSIPDVEDLQDNRIVAAIALNPVSNPIFSESGMSQLDLPLMIVSGNADLFAPALDEQLEPFTWLPISSNKYLVLIDNSTHFSFIGTDPKLQLPQIESNFSLSSSYLKVLSVAFFQAYLSEQVEFKAYLTRPYLNSLSRQPLPINILRYLKIQQLKN